MPVESFFGERTEPSRVKAQIVAKYFDAWASVMVGSQNRDQSRWGTKIGYFDLFAGPGRYGDGNSSTPILVLEQAIKKEELKTRIVTIFNEGDNILFTKLQVEVNSLAGLDSLTYQPKFYNRDVSLEFVNQALRNVKYPTFSFVDPWGYKDISLELIRRLVQGWGCDCLLFFNYTRINGAISYDKFSKHVNALFGKQSADELRVKVKNLNKDKREELVVTTFCRAIQDSLGSYAHPFAFKDEEEDRTSHYVILITKHIKGFNIAKQITAKLSSENVEGVPSFRLNSPKDLQPSFSFDDPIDELCTLLLSAFGGQTLPVKKIFQIHSANKKYIEKNYKESLLRLENQSEITVTPPSSKRAKGTMGDNVIVTFRKGVD